MKYRLLLLILVSFCLSAYSQTENPKYDKLLADSLRGDDYGMKTYILVILKTGSNKIEDKKTLDSLFQGHMDNIGRMAAIGKLIVAGPLGKNEKAYRGIFILNVKSIEEATALLETDPTIKEKVLEAELYKWYGSAALPTYLPNHEKIEKKKM
ncbi:MAG: YciI family protein [Bacteroidales bacterium]